MAEIVVKEQLQQYIDRVERLEADKADIAEDIKEVFSEAKSNGFDTKTMKQVIKIRKLDKEKLAEQDAMLELYRDALGV